MVDSINGAGGPLPPQNTGNRTQTSKNAQRSETSSADATQDAVSISAEAEETQALQLASDTRSLISQQQEDSLTRTGQRVNTLL